MRKEEHSPEPSLNDTLPDDTVREDEASATRTSNLNMPTKHAMKDVSAPM